MSWHFLQEEAEASWQGNSLDGAPSALSRLIPTPVRSSLPDNEMECSRDSQSGTTSRRSTGNHGAGQLTLFPEDFLAKTSAQQVGVEALPEIVQVFGLKCFESLARSGLVLSSRKTLRTFVPVGLAPLSKGLSAWGMTADGGCWELGTSALLIDDTGSGLLLPTPTTQGSELSPSMQKWPAHRNLIKMLPTPLASDGPHKERGKGSMKRQGGPRLTVEKTGGLWNTFREWMMGWPIGWTALEPLATDRFQQWQRSHGGSSACDRTVA